MRFARVLERRGDPAGDVYLRAVVAPPVFVGEENEAALRALIEALDRRGEHDVLDALRPEVEKRFRVGHVFAKALGKRGSLEALDSYVRGDAHHWERCTRIDGALSTLVQRGAEGLRLVRGWLELPKTGEKEKERAFLWAQSRLAQAACWLGDEATARKVMTLLEGEVAKQNQFDSMTGKTELAPLCASMGEVPRATALLREGEADWDAIFDEDIDGYGRISRNALQRAQARVQHLEAQGRLPLEKRTWDGAEPKRLYEPPRFNSFVDYGELRQDLTDLLEAKNFDGALAFIEAPREQTEWSHFLRMFADALEVVTPAQCARLLELHRRIEAARVESRSAWHTPSLCGLLARSGHQDEAFAAAEAIRGGNLTDRASARLACAEAVIGRKLTHFATRAALNAVIAEMSEHQRSDSQTDVFSTPLTLAELLLPFA
ncbi:MAG: hypothetical protein JNM17_15795 [Archangium sp.]|nr:hypothetical protein [Archangium sp.]